MKADMNQPEPLVVFNEPQREAAMLVERIKAKAAQRGELLMLEAGCGNSWQLDLAGVPYVLTGVDLNEAALNIRRFEKRDLHDAVLGDLRTVSLPENRFDVIYNSFVLEHIPNAELVLDNFFRWLRPGGILILRIPDPRSVYGFLSRLTPFWFHVFYKRYIEGRKTAGLPGYDPFPTIYDDVVSRQGIRRWCAEHSVTSLHEIGWNYPVCRPGPLSYVVNGMIKAFAALSLGKLSADHVNLTYVIEKPARQPAQIEAPRPALQMTPSN